VNPPFDPLKLKDAKPTTEGVYPSMFAVVLMAN
jgi:hypothetical protein